MQYLLTMMKFDDIYSIADKITNKQKGDLFEYLTYYLFKLNSVLNNDLQNIWMYNDIPINIKKYLELSSRDKGIDLLAQINNDYYAIQCKFRKNTETIINWTEVSTFFGLSFGLHDKIKGGFFVTNTYDLCNEIIISTKIKSVYGDFFDNIPNIFFDNIRRLNENKKIEYIKKNPFSYQQECINKCNEYYKTEKKGFIEMACGSGKTLTSYWIDSILNNKLTVIFVPSLYLLSQFYSDWVNQSHSENKQIKYILIGSDADVNDDIIYKSNGLILETDLKCLQAHIDSFKNNKLVIICTYHSSNLLLKIKDISIDFGIFDEAHKTVGQINKQFSLMLHNENIKIDRKLFMTATLKIYINNFNNDVTDSLDDDLDDSAMDDIKNDTNKKIKPRNDILSMDNYEYYGKLVYKYNTGNAIRENRLVDYQIITIIATNKHIEDDIKKNNLISFNGTHF